MSFLKALSTTKVVIFLFVVLSTFLIAGTTAAHDSDRQQSRLIAVGPPLPSPGDGGGTSTQPLPERKPVPLTFTPNVPIPGLFEGKDIKVDESLFGNYISNFYVFFAGVAGILAVVVMMWGGFHYITSAGNPQRMNQGKEIINNALIGLILVLTSYLLLNTINPRLLQLRVPLLATIDEVLQPQRYCEGGPPEAIAAANAQDATCGKQVDYVVNGKQFTCTALFIRDQFSLDWKDQLACFPKITHVQVKTGDTTTIETRVDYLPVKAAGVQGVCEKEEYTPDDRCSATQDVLQLQTWLKGACKKAKRASNKDICNYRQKFNSCPEGKRSVACNIKGNDNSPCWRDGKPFFTEQPPDHTQAYCINITLNNPPISKVDSVCCKENSKINVACPNVACSNDSVEVSCAEFNQQPGFFNNSVLTQCDDTTPGTTRRCCARLSLYPGPNTD